MAAVRDGFLGVVVAVAVCVGCSDGGDATSGVAASVRQCGLLTEGRVSWKIASSCRAQCYNAASCRALESVVCDRDDRDASLDSCLDACTFQCGSGETIEDIYECDGFADCEDESDEVVCEGSLFTCDDGTKILSEYQCDTEPDCEDGSDEVGCNGTSTFSCASGETVPGSYECDGGEDCSDGSDEDGCAEPICD